MKKFIIGIDFVNEIMKSIFGMNYERNSSSLPSAVFNNWLPKNYQNQAIKEANKKQGDVCPKYEIIKKVVGFIGVSSDDLLKFKYFCGVFTKDLTMSRSGIGRSFTEVVGLEEIPCRFCCVVGYILSLFLEIVKQPVFYKKEIKEIKDYISSIKPNIKSIEVLEKKVLELKDALVVYEQMRQVLKFWSKKEGVENSEATVIARVEEVLKNFQAQLGSDFSFYPTYLEISCPQSPRHQSKQWKWID